MSKGKGSDFSVKCPCCGAHLTIDSGLRQVIAHSAPHKPTVSVDLDRAQDLLREEEARREALFNQSAEAMKTRAQVLERKFAAALEKSKDEPITPPTRDIDLD